jgi:hypothetical protein
MLGQDDYCTLTCELGVASSLALSTSKVIIVDEELEGGEEPLVE